MTVHDKMIDSIIRSPATFFDNNPSGILTNRFSTDLGIIDTNIIFSLWDSVEGPFIIIIAIVNICQINIYFLIPAVILLTIVVVYFKYSRASILNCKQLDLQNKSPIINFYE
jgi:ABC-type multidrug transport system fused ATPase/permease subunit